ncbi:MAG TPA: hypothetical protein VFS92_10335 [Planctomycetota bacterium]|nr:hypothetical protein [Planctomycetota bacterium]
MADALAPAPVKAPRKRKGEITDVGRRWCSICCSLPTPQSVRPKVVSLGKAGAMFEFPCSVEGCEGIVRLTGPELMAFQQAGMIAHVPADLRAMARVQNRALKLLETSDDDQTRVQAGKLVLSVARDRLKMAGMVPGGTPSLTVNAETAQFVIDPGDSLDREMERMYREQRTGEREVPVEVVEPTPRPKPSPTLPSTPAPETPAPDDFATDDPGGWT